MTFKFITHVTTHFTLVSNWKNLAPELKDGLLVINRDKFFANRELSVQGLHSLKDKIVAKDMYNLGKWVLWK